MWLANTNSSKFHQDIGHDWPSTQPNSDNLTPGRHPATFNASSLILDFFREHPLRLD